MYFGECVLERRVMVRLVFEGQTIRPRHTAMPVEHGLIGVYCERRVHITRMIEGHLDGGHQVRQLATAVDNTPNADRLRLRQHWSTSYTGTSGCPFSCASWLIARAKGITEAT